MTDPGYVYPANNVKQLDIFGPLAVAATTNIVSSSLKTVVNPYGKSYLQSTGQDCSVFVVYISISAADSLIVTRLQTSTNNTITEQFAAEVANQPNWHAFEVTQYEQINLQLSGSCNILKLCVMEVKQPGGA
jgi:hypothetical protein